MSNTEDSTTTPMRPRRAGHHRKDGNTQPHSGAEVSHILKPRRNDQRNTPRAVSNQNIISPQAIDSATLSMEELELGTKSASSAARQPKHKKKKGERTQPEQINVYPQSPPPGSHSTLQGTPMRSMQIYAGPTFHASPAASSLPMPKFFSQSMLAEKVDEPAAPSEGEPSGDSSSSHAGGDSPTMRPSLRVMNQQAREPSPLDIFFNADRQQRANRASLGPLDEPERAKSASPGQNLGSPMQSMFAKPPQSPPATMDSNYAKTQALKQLLLFPQAQKSPSIQERTSVSPFMDIPTRPGASLGRTVSETSTPTRFALNSNETPSEKSFYDSPNLSTPPSSARPPQARRPLHPHLRQEFLKSLPLNQSPDISSRIIKPTSTRQDY